MKRVSLIACVLLLGAVAAAPAKADFSIVRWNTTHWCQIWDNSIGNKPWPEDYTIAAAGLPTFDAAWAAINTMIQSKQCGW